MADGRARSQWAQVSSLMALIANANRSKNSRTFKPSDFSPFKDERKRVATKADIEFAREMFEGMRGKNHG